jgi:hypothetical protein
MKVKDYFFPELLVLLAPGPAKYNLAILIAIIPLTLITIIVPTTFKANVWKFYTSSQKCCRDIAS